MLKDLELPWAGCIQTPHEDEMAAQSQTYTYDYQNPDLVGTEFTVFAPSTFASDTDKLCMAYYE